MLNPLQFLNSPRKTSAGWLPIRNPSSYCPFAAGDSLKPLKTAEFRQKLTFSAIDGQESEGLDYDPAGCNLYLRHGGLSYKAFNLPSIRRGGV